MSIIVFAQSKISTSKVSERKFEECGDRVGNFVLCIETEKSEYKLNEPIILQISLKNVSDRKVQVIRSSGNYSLDVKNTNGKSVPYLNNSHNFITQNWISGRNIVEIEPTKKIYKSIVLTDVYNLKNAGSYSITAKWRVLQNAPDKNGERSSQARNYTVAPKPLIAAGYVVIRRMAFGLY